MPGRKYSVGGAYRYEFNGKEKDNSTGEGNLDFGARIYDSRIGRWLSTDPKTAKFTSWSPYNFGIDNPVNVIDPDGEEIILLIWATVNGDAGHAAIAVRNYVTEKVKVKGRWKEIHKPTDTYTLYELGPNDVGANIQSQEWKATALRLATYEPSKPVTKDELLANTYKNGKQISKFDKNAADGIIEFGDGSDADYKNDNKASTSLLAKNVKSDYYQGIGNNCKSYCSDVIPIVGGDKLDANVTVEVKNKKATFQVPNKLFVEASKLKGAKVLKALPKLLANKSYMDAYQTSSKSKYDEPKTENKKTAPSGKSTTIDHSNGRIM